MYLSEKNAVERVWCYPWFQASRGGLGMRYLYGSSPPPTGAGGGATV